MGKSFFKVNEVRDFCLATLKAVGAREEIAAIVSDVLIAADLRGISSHGISRLPIYIKRINLGLMAPDALPSVVRENKCTALLDGRNGFGQVGAYYGMEKCIDMAQKEGVGIAGVFNTNHIGMAAYFAMMTLKNRMIGMVMANASAHMPAWGGIKPCLGTNPIAIAVPAGKYPPIVLDMATSAVARGKIIMAARRGEPIPLGWALNKEGLPTQDANEALEGLILPLGGPKGYGLSLIIDVLAGVLTGANFGSKVPSMTGQWTEPLNMGVWLLAFKVDNFMPFEEFINRVDELIADIKDSPLAPGFEKIYIPGEIETEVSIKYQKEGIPLDDELVAELRDLSKLTGVCFSM